MTLRFLRLLACRLLLVFACATAHAADGIEITKAAIEASEDGYRLDTAYAFDLNHGLTDAIQHGVQLHFTTEVELTRPRWWWRDEQAVSERRTIRISYDVLTRQSYVHVVGSQQVLHREASLLDGKARMREEPPDLCRHRAWQSVL